MSDVQTVWNDTSNGADWAMAGADLASGDDLTTAVYLSLFTDRRAADDDKLVDNTQNRRGWWGDTGSDSQIGSRLWLLARAKQDDDTLLLAEQYAEEALQWLITDEVAASIDVNASWVRAGLLGLVVTIIRSSGTTFTRQYDYIWKEIG